MWQSRISFLSIKLVMIEKNSSSMHREYHKFYAVHVYLRSICINLLLTKGMGKFTIGRPTVEHVVELFYDLTQRNISIQGVMKTSA